MTDLDLTPDEIDYVIYHDPCADGMGAACVAWKYLSTKFPNRTVTYCPMTYKRKPPEDISGKNVLLCDVTFDPGFMKSMMASTNKLLILDHHKTAEIDLHDIPKKNKIFDMNRSGAMLAWNFFHPGDKPPLLIEYIQDRDIWTKKLPYINEYSAWFLSEPLNFQVYDKYMNNDTLFLEMLLKIGKPCYNQIRRNINMACKHAVPKFICIEGKYYFVAYLNSTTLISDIGNALLKKLPYIDFSAIYHINDWSNSTKFSLRSSNKHVDVSKIAKILNGGGHRNASGLVIETVTNNLTCITYDSTGRLYYKLSNIYYNILDIGKKKYNVIYMNSNIHKSKLGEYLLQNKYNENDFPIQECTEIIRTRDKSDFYKRFQIAAIWSNDVCSTNFSITLDDSMKPDDIENLESFFGMKCYDSIAYTGNHHTIPLNQKPV